MNGDDEFQSQVRYLNNKWPKESAKFEDGSEVQPDEAIRARLENISSRAAELMLINNLTLDAFTQINPDFANGALGILEDFYALDNEEVKEEAKAQFFELVTEFVQEFIQSGYINPPDLG